METRAILDERQHTHGDFSLNAQVSQELKGVLERAIRREDNRAWYNAFQLEAIDMICHKLSRIVAGNPHEPDHWADIAGYAQLVVDRLDKDINSSTGMSGDKAEISTL